MRKIIWILSLLSFSFSVVASCLHYGERLDLRETQKKVMQYLPVVSQRSYGLCYAYSAAFLMSFQHIKQGGHPFQSISPLESGFYTNMTLNQTGEEGGDTCQVINAISDRGLACKDGRLSPEERFKDVGVTFNKLFKDQVFGPYYSESGKIFNQAVTKTKFHKRIGLKQKDLTYLTNFDVFYTGFKNYLEAKKIIIPPADEIFEMTQAVQAKISFNFGNAFLRLLFDHSCKDAMFKVTPLRCHKEIRSWSADPLMSEIDKSLNTQKPAGIHFCSTVLTNRKAAGIGADGLPRPNDYPVDSKGHYSEVKHCAPHASAIIGRKVDDSGKCHYLIRNSWGTQFDYAWPDEDDDIWISEEAIKKNVYEVIVTH